MKKVILFSAVTAVAALSYSCNVDNAEKITPEGSETNSGLVASEVISASIPATKTTLDGTKICWEANDAISLFNADGAPVTYGYTGTAGETSGTFQIMENQQPDPNGYAYAIYPVQEAATISGSTPYVLIPQTQTYAANGGFSAKYPMAAKTSDGISYGFENIFAVVCVSLAGEGTISSLTLSSLRADDSSTYPPMSGYMGIDFANNFATVLGETTYNYVTLDCRNEGNYVTLSDTPTTFSFVVFAGKYANGLQLTVTETNGNTTTKSIGTANGINIAAGEKAVFTSTLTIDTPQGWVLVGSFTDNWNSWKETNGKAGGLYYWSNVTVPENQTEFKVRYAADSNQYYGYNGEFAAPTVTGLSKEGGNISITAGTYDFYFEEINKVLIAMEAGSSPFGICGSMTSWGGASDIPFVIDGQWLVAKGVELASNAEFKIRFANKWGEHYGSGLAFSNSASDRNISTNTALTLYASDNDNMIVPETLAGTYDLYFDYSSLKLWVMTQGTTPTAE